MTVDYPRIRIESSYERGVQPDWGKVEPAQLETPDVFHTHIKRCLTHAFGAGSSVRFSVWRTHMWRMVRRTPCPGPCITDPIGLLCELQHNLATATLYIVDADTPYSRSNSNAHRHH